MKKNKAASAPVRKKAGAAKKRTAGKPAPKAMAAKRADYGAPIDGFFAKQPPAMREILVALRAIVEEVIPDATAALKWGTPFYMLREKMIVGLAGFKSHVNLILVPGPYEDPDGLLEGTGKSRHLKLRSLKDLPRDAVRRWVRVAAKHA